MSRQSYLAVAIINCKRNMYYPKILLREGLHWLLADNSYVDNVIYDLIYQFIHIFQTEKT